MPSQPRRDAGASRAAVAHAAAVRKRPVTATSALATWGDTTTFDWVAETPVNFPSATGQTTRAWLWMPPASRPRGLVLVAHGMAEHARRYVGLAQDLARAGYATAALDHAGHGETCPAPQKRGVFDPANGATQLLQDFHTLREVVAARVGALPPFVLGHSMGSFLVRAYLPLHAQGLAGAIIMSTGSQAAASLAGGRAVVRLLAAMKGWDYRSKFVDGLGVGSYNRAFEKTVEAPTGVEWLSRDASQVAAYNSDPACGFMFSLSGYAMLFDLISRAQAPSAVELPHELPLLLLAGEQDPVGSFGRAPRELAATYTAAGVEDVDLIMYPGARHELLHELNASEVTADLVAWLEAHTPAPAPATPKVARRRERPYEL